MEATITYSAVRALRRNARVADWASRVRTTSAHRLPFEMEDFFIQHYDGSLPVLRDCYSSPGIAVEQALSTTVHIKQDSHLAVTNPPDVLFGFHVDLPDVPFADLGPYTHTFVQACLYPSVVASCVVKRFGITCSFYIQHSTPGTKPTGVVYGSGVHPPALRHY